MKIRLCNMRLTGDNAGYYKKQFETFANSFDAAKISSIEFGKQDIRGGFSITLYDHKHCVPKQHFFDNKEQMIGFVLGYNQFVGAFNVFKPFIERA